MSGKYIAKKYVTVGSVFIGTVKCPNCHLRMLREDDLFHCANGEKKCKLFGIPFREVKSLTTIERGRASNTLVLFQIEGFMRGGRKS